jgi:hypothetical protein
MDKMIAILLEITSALLVMFLLLVLFLFRSGERNIPSKKVLSDIQDIKRQISENTEK